MNASRCSSLCLYTVSSLIVASRTTILDLISDNKLFNFTILNVQVIFLSLLPPMIIQDKAAVGVFPNIPENSNLKVLFVAQDDESIAYGPSIENLYYSDYFIRLPFYIVYKL